MGARFPMISRRTLAVAQLRGLNPRSLPDDEGNNPENPRTTGTGLPNSTPQRNESIWLPNSLPNADTRSNRRRICSVQALQRPVFSGLPSTLGCSSSRVAGCFCLSAPRVPMMVKYLSLCKPQEVVLARQNAYALMHGLPFASMFSCSSSEVSTLQDCVSTS